MCNKRNHSICYTTTAYEVHTFKNKNKRKSLRDIFVYQFFCFISVFRSCKFIMIEIRPYSIAYDENFMNSLISQSI